MRADSLLYGVRRVDEQGDRLLSMRTFSGPGPLRCVDIALAALVDIAELLRAAAPFPPRTEARSAGGSGTADARTDGAPTAVDEAIASVLAVSYKCGSATVDQLDAAAAAGIADDGRLETVDSHVVVPLAATGPHTRNWSPVIEALLARLDDVLKDFERVARRAEASATNGPLEAGCRTVVKMLGTLVQVVRQADADTRYVRDRTDHSQRELLLTIEAATTQLRSNNDA